MIGAICAEGALRNDYLHEDIATVYFGGGTPSLITIYDLRFTIEKLKSLFTVVDDVEITLEANPDDITEEKLEGWKSVGINRLSIGVQSFFDEDLQWMNRAHNSLQARAAVALSKEAGFENLSIDLIYGVPGLTDQGWQQNLETAFDYGVPHLSCYALTVEPKTALRKMIEHNKTEDVSAERQAAQFELLMEFTNAAGYEQYEISNFSKPGFRSKHNSSYWQGKPYLGLGPSAHSYNGLPRQWNVSNNALYIESISKKILPQEEELLTQTQKVNEYLMTSLRTSEGISLKAIAEISDERTALQIFKEAQKFIHQKLIGVNESTLFLTRKGKLFADGIASDLFRM